MKVFQPVPEEVVAFLICTIYSAVSNSCGLPLLSCNLEHFLNEILTRTWHIIFNEREHLESCPSHPLGGYTWEGM